MLLTNEPLEKETQDNALPVSNREYANGVKACVQAYVNKEHKDVWDGC